MSTPSERPPEPSIDERIDAREERIHVSIGAVCNNNCIFCMEEDRDERYVVNSAMTPERVRWILERHRGAEEACFTSGEPTTRPELPQFIAWVRELGFTRISLMTNGRRMSQLPYAAALVKAGLNRVYVSIHGHEKKLHESLTRTPDSFEQTVGGLHTIRQLKRFGVELHTSTVLTKRNLPFLGEIYGFLRAQGVDQVVFNVMQANGRADTHFEQIFPSYTETARQFREFLERCSEERPMAFLVDIPLCATEGIPDFNRGYVERHSHYNLVEHAILDGFDAQARAESGEGEGLVRIGRSDLDESNRSKRAECKTCRYDAQCEGVWTNYARRMGWAELVPVSPRAAAAVTG